MRGNKEFSPGISLEGMMLKLKLQYFGHLMWRVEKRLIGKDSNAWRDWGQEEKGMTEDEMAGWHHWLDGHEFGWTPGVSDGQGGLACCDSWGRKELDTIEQLNCTDLSSLLLDLWHMEYLEIQKRSWVSLFTIVSIVFYLQPTVSTNTACGWKLGCLYLCSSLDQPDV